MACLQLSLSTLCISILPDLGLTQTRLDLPRVSAAGRVRAWAQFWSLLTE